MTFLTNSDILTPLIEEVTKEFEAKEKERLLACEEDVNMYQRVLLEIKNYKLNGTRYRDITRESKTRLKAYYIKGDPI